MVDKVREALATRGAVFFQDLVRMVQGFPPDVLAALWELVWSGEVSNDTLQPLRSLARGGEPDRKRGVRISRALPGSEGRFSLLHYGEVTETARRLTLVERLLLRHGVLVRDAIKAEGVAGGFSSIYEVLKAMEDTGRVRRGYFVEGLGAAQFVEPGMDERLRGQREVRERPSGRDAGAGSAGVTLASTDPASPWGQSLPWPPSASRPMRASGANVVVAPDGRLLAWIARKEHSVVTFFRDEDAARRDDADLVARSLAAPVDRGERKATLISQIDGDKAAGTALGEALLRAGFQDTWRGLLKRLARRPGGRHDHIPDAAESDDDVVDDADPGSAEDGTSAGA
jgi:ATP-dependent Lhr-like helicase